ncbi:unnamed protein product, partial [Effrenium voratum]
MAMGLDQDQGGSLSRAVTQAFEDLAEVDVAGGQLHDLAIRSQIKAAKPIPALAWVRRQCRLLADMARVEMVSQMLRREQLLSIFRSAIVSESKRRKLLPATGSKQFKSQALFVYKVSRERSCINHMVQNWSMMQRLLSYAPTSDCTQLNERVEKASSFWSERVSTSPKRVASPEQSREPSRPMTADPLSSLPSLTRNGSLRCRVLRDRISALAEGAPQVTKLAPVVQSKRLPRWAKVDPRPVTTT